MFLLDSLFSGPSVTEEIILFKLPRKSETDFHILEMSLIFPSF